MQSFLSAGYSFGLDKLAKYRASGMNTIFIALLAFLVILAIIRFLSLNTQNKYVQTIAKKTPVIATASVMGFIAFLMGIIFWE